MMAATAGGALAGAEVVEKAAESGVEEEVEEEGVEKVAEEGVDEAMVRRGNRFLSCCPSFAFTCFLSILYSLFLFSILFLRGYQEAVGGRLKKRAVGINLERKVRCRSMNV